MTRQVRKAADVYKILNDQQKRTHDQTERLNGVLTLLCYEGKPSLGKNLKATHKVLNGFASDIKKHMTLEEKIVFPFLERHVPKVETVIHLMRNEHKGIDKNLKEVKELVRKISKNGGSTVLKKNVGKLWETGTYLIYFLRSHLHAENEGILKIIKQDLRQEEKNALRKKISKKGFKSVK